MDFNFNYTDGSKHVELLKENLKKPKGSAITVMELDYLSVPDNDLILTCIASGMQIFILERSKENIFTFYHFMPGVGNREASVDLNKLGSFKKLYVIFTWSPKKMSLWLKTDIVEIKANDVMGAKSKKYFRVAEDGLVHGFNVDMQKNNMLHFYRDGKLVVQPTALEAWSELLFSINVLMEGTSEGELFETIISNSAISMLVTGFETYAKRRFLEIEGEGIKPRVTKVIRSFYGIRERSSNIVQVINDEALKQNITPLRYIVEKNRINFQNFDKCKLAYNKAYKIQFGNLGFSSVFLEELKKYFLYRHRIIHIHPATPILNPDKVGTGEEVHPTRKTVTDAVDLFSKFIKQFHQVTLDISI